MSKPSIEDVNLGDKDGGVTQVSYLAMGKYDFPEMCSTLKKEKPTKHFDQVINRLIFLSGQRIENVKVRWLKSWPELRPVLQMRLDDEVRLYNFHYHEAQRRLILLNWTKKKSADTDSRITNKAKKWREIAIDILKG